MCQCTILAKVLSHNNVPPLLGVCNDEQDLWWHVHDIADKGSLRRWRQSSNPPIAEINGRVCPIGSLFPHCLTIVVIWGSKGHSTHALTGSCAGLLYWWGLYIFYFSITWCKHSSLIRGTCTSLTLKPKLSPIAYRYSTCNKPPKLSSLTRTNVAVHMSGTYFCLAACFMRWFGLCSISDSFVHYIS